MDFTNRTAIVTGGADGIGRATALRLASHGVKVAVVDIAEEKIENVVGEIKTAGGTALGLTVDVTDNAAIKDAVQKVIAEFGKIDILVNNAGSGWHKSMPFKDMPLDSWQWVLDLNINGTLNFTRVVLDNMIENNYGRIINLASVAAKNGIPKLAIYSATKGAIVSFTKALAMELGPHNINVNCVSPGLITHATEAPESNGTFLCRWGLPDEVATLITFLASDEASFITGADHLVDGGRTLGPRGA